MLYIPCHFLCCTINMNHEFHRCGANSAWGAHCLPSGPVVSSTPFGTATQHPACSALLASQVLRPSGGATSNSQCTRDLLCSCALLCGSQIWKSRDLFSAQKCRTTSWTSAPPHNWKPDYLVYNTFSSFLRITSHK